MKDEPIRTGSTPVLHSEPRDLTGTPAHAKLREALGVPAGGYAPRPSSRPRSDNPNTNLTATILKRAAERQDEQREKALQAWADYQAGATIHELEAKYHMASETMTGQWRRAGIPYEPRNGRTPADRSDDARAAWRDRMDGYTLKYVLAKYNLSENNLRNHWRRLGLTPPARNRRFIR